MSISRFLNACEHWAKAGPLRFALVMIGLLFLLILSIFRCAYQTNDDPVMMMIASGTGISSAPDEHLIFTNVLIGLVLKQLYTWFALVPWYAMYLVGTQYLSHVAILYSILTWRYTRRHAELFYLFLLTVGVYYLTNLQFTITAFYATEAGLILGLTTLCRRAENPSLPVWKLLSAAGGLIVLGALIRIDSLLGTLAVSALPAAFLLWPMRRSRHMLKPALICGSACMGLIVAAQLFHNSYYQRDPAWCKFFEYNALRLKFNDHQWTHYDAETKAIFDKVHWTENDHDMVRNWYYEDDQLFSTDNLRAIITSADWKPPTTAPQRILDFYRSLYRDHATWPLLLMLPLFVWCGVTRRTTLHLTALGIGSAVLLLLFVSVMVKPPPPRVYYPLLANQLVLCLLMGRCGPAFQPHTTGQWLLLHLGVVRRNSSKQRELVFTLAVSNALPPTLLFLVAFLGAVMLQSREYRHSTIISKNAYTFRRSLREIAPQDNELYVNWGGSMPVECMSPFENPRVLNHFHMLMLGWTQRTPFQDAMKARFHIDDLAKDLVNRNDLFMMSSDFLNEYFDTFAREHQQAELEWKSCYNCKLYEIWKPYRAPPSHNDLLEPNPDRALTSGARIRRFN